MAQIDADEDRAAIGQLMSRFLGSVSFEPGGRPAYRDLPELFIVGAKLIKASTDAPEVSDVDEFVQPRQQVVDTGEMASFHEAEVHAITELFGNVAHRVSSYRKRGTLNGAAIDVRGAIFTQFVRTPDGWRISAMAWDDERPGCTLPAHLTG
jgi:hypothetical protein